MPKHYNGEMNGQFVLTKFSWLFRFNQNITITHLFLIPFNLWKMEANTKVWWWYFSWISTELFKAPLPFVFLLYWPVNTDQKQTQRQKTTGSLHIGSAGASKGICNLVFIFTLETSQDKSKKKDLDLPLWLDGATDINSLSGLKHILCPA